MRQGHQPPGRAARSKDGARPSATSTSGDAAFAVTPPAYGIDFIDRGGAQDAPIQRQVIEVQRKVGTGSYFYSTLQTPPRTAFGSREEAEYYEIHLEEPPAGAFSSAGGASAAGGGSADEVFKYVHDPHGKGKHFGRPLKVGSQWSLTFDAADALMLQGVMDQYAKLIANSPPGRVTTFYLTVNHGSDVGAVDTPDGTTSVYTVQIDVDRKLNIITYHGYPVEEKSATIGLGKTVKKKDL